MFYRIAADFLVILHLGFIVFVLIGGLFILRWRWVFLLHIPAAVWGTLIELQGWQCPLTPLEQYFRQFNGLSYQGGFVDHYILPLVYPTGLTRQMQIFFGISVVIVNGVIYGFLIVRHHEDPETCLHCLTPHRSHFQTIGVRNGDRARLIPIGHYIFLGGV